MVHRTTTIRPGTWQFGHPRVLIEHSDEATALSYADALRRAGYAVGICRGPSDGRHPPERCVLTTGEACAAVDGADVVVSGLGVDEPETRAVLDALRRHHPNKPLVVELAPDEVERYADLIDGLHLVVSPVQRDELVAAVEDAGRV